MLRTVLSCPFYGVTPIRHLFDWLVMGQVVPFNPAASVSGPDVARQHRRDHPDRAARRALIALIVYSFGRIRAALAMRVEDVFVQNRRLWVWLREKVGKRHEMPCHYTLEEYLHTYLDGTGITAYLKNGGTLENAAAMANHASTRTTQLYDRRRDDISLDEVERIRV